MEKLKPCPFCGGRVSITYNSGEKAFAVWHTKEPCFIEPLWISGDDAKTLNEAYAFWNRRADLYVGGVGGRYYKAPNSIEEVIIEGEKDEFMTEAYRQGYDHGYENAKEDVLLQLMDDLNIAEECEKCPRWDGRCKGHLQWLCRKIREAMDDTSD